MSEKKFKLDLSEYEIEVTEPKVYVDGTAVLNEDKRPVMVTKNIVYPLRRNLSEFLRTVGMFKNSTELVEAVMLAKRIRDNSADSMLLDEKEVNVLKQVIDKHLQLTAEGKGCLGGILHEEALCRVVNMEEITE